jgi:excisionase family DNA binding protein
MSRKGEVMTMRKRELQDYYKVMFTEYPDVVNVEQLCEMLGGPSSKSVYRLLNEGAIQSYWIGKRYRIPKVSVIEYLTGLQKSVS